MCKNLPIALIIPQIYSGIPYSVDEKLSQILGDFLILHFISLDIYD